jgi:hypothetical protein
MSNALSPSPRRSARKPPVVAPVHMPRSGRGESNLLPKFQALQKQVPRGSPLRNEAGRAIASQSTKIAGGIKEEDEDEYEPRREDKRNVLLPSTNGRANGAEVRPVQRDEQQVKDTGKVASSRRTPYDKVVSYLDSAIAYREKGEKVKVPGQSPPRRYSTISILTRVALRQIMSPSGQRTLSHAGWITLTSMEWDMPLRMGLSECSSTMILPWSLRRTKSRSTRHHSPWLDDPSLTEDAWLVAGIST